MSFVIKFEDGTYLRRTGTHTGRRIKVDNVKDATTWRLPNHARSALKVAVETDPKQFPPGIRAKIQPVKFVEFGRPDFVQVNRVKGDISAKEIDTPVTDWGLPKSCPDCCGDCQPRCWSISGV